MVEGRKRICPLVPSKTKTPSFEEAIQQLEEITRQLERGSLSLDASIQAYEKGMYLGELCSKMLKRAERKLESIERNESGTVERKTIEMEEGEEGSTDQSRLFQ